MEDKTIKEHEEFTATHDCEYNVLLIEVECFANSGYHLCSMELSFEEIEEIYKRMKAAKESDNEKQN